MPEISARAFFGSVSWLLIASVAAVSLLAWIVAPLKRAFLLVPVRVKEKYEVYRLLTAGWIHSDITHLLFNMLSLYFFAEPAAKVLGVTRFLALYVSSVVVAFIPTTIRHRNNPRYATLGASGAVSAVIFSAVLLNPSLKVAVMFIPIPVPGIAFAIGYLVYSAYLSYRAKDNVNHDAHFYGAAYGALLTYVFEPARVERSLRSFF